MYTVQLDIHYVGTVDGESKEDAKRICGAILEELTKVVKPYSEKVFQLTVEKVEDDGVLISSFSRKG